ncbi:MAG: serine/threonine protein kinase [Pseudobutyrivibrio sp.]|uniref:Serine/threonine protein kinase n=1 Tax=Pseudobutyrivibrio ruminis TaxID=46206 RepID=A0A2G3DXU9_9FIRM|nr:MULTISPECIES: serine/threonine-protein kinase [Pseudobutyrivibrio]MBE5904971.1 serine/threonine protein kinase [Pseudobutyrivibrio sp.]PHU35685.1 serine/threonine protein kinase [Pseudobutyrivibrio ruminis]SCX94049.1 serine/threonine protein kinase [Pseudobutyrivibrio sp. AR14]
MLKIGSVIDGKYKILNRIGQGGMSTVYLAMNERANKQWAVKEIRKTDSSEFAVTLASIKTETELLKNLSHPNLPSIADIIDYEGSILVVMDYIEGNTLSLAVKDYGPQPQEYVIEWAKQLCNVLGYLHSQEPPIIYRDLKPGNIMLRPDGRLVLIDFGTARRYKVENIEDTTCLGTRGYAAPEQFGGQGQTDARTDIYCLGSTMYHLLTGKNPSEPPYEMYPIRYWDDRFSQGLEKIILKCTQLDPNKRYQNCAELLYDLEHYNELDNSYRRKEKIKMASFVAMLTLSIITGIGSWLMKSDAKAVQGTNYDSYVDYAQKSDTFEDKEESYISAISIDPSKADAYIDLLDKVYLEDGVFSEEEAQTIRQVLITPDHKRTYEEILSTNEAGYALFAYRMGIAYFYSYEGGGNKQQSAYWFHKVNDGLLSESQTERAERLGSIADYYINLGNVDKTGDNKVSYSEYWDDLVAVCDGNIAELDNPNTALIIYKEMASQININAAKYHDDGISYDQMNLQLINIEEHIKSDISKDEIEQSEVLKEMVTELKTNIEKARQTLELLEKQ